MTNSGRRDRNQPAVTAFLVERYVSPSAATSLSSSVARLARLCLDEQDLGVRYLQSAYLPADDTCFCWFSAYSEQAISEINARADFALDRIAAAIVLLPSHCPQPLDRGTEP